MATVVQRTRMSCRVAETLVAIASDISATAGLTSRAHALSLHAASAFDFAGVARRSPFAGPEHTCRGCRDFADARGTPDHLISEPANLVDSQSPECRYDDDTFRRHEMPQFLEHLPRLGQAAQIDNHGARPGIGPAMASWNRPAVEGDDLVSVFNELGPYQRSLRPFGPERKDIGTCVLHHGCPDPIIAVQHPMSAQRRPPRNAGFVRPYHSRMTRREALALLTATVSAATPRRASAQSTRWRLPKELPTGISAILDRLLAQPPSSMNTDWFGTMPLVGMLQWSRRGISEVEPFARTWLSHHLQTREVANYQGNRARLVWAGGIPLTTYAGHFGVSQVCEELAAQFNDERARRVAIEVAEIVLHRTSRNWIGLIGHDDTADFAIPDVTFFAVSSLMIGARLTAPSATAYCDQALFQLRTSIDVFLMHDTGLARTLYRKDGVGKTSWTRASGWLLWAITAMLRRLDPAHAAFRGFTTDLRRLVDGMVRVQEPNGGLHVLLDDRSTPLDATGPAMFALGVHESVRRGWLPGSYGAAAEKAWEFVKANLTDEGVLRNTYWIWALPAEKRDMRLRDETSGWAMGFVLAAANEMTL